VTILAYLPLFGNGFVNYDDDLYILDNPHIQHGLGVDTIVWAFSTFRGANWFPLTWLSWAADFSLFGGSAAAFHASSLALHVATAVLLFVAFVQLTGARWRSALVAALFALHPLHVESVAWAAARKDVLSGFFAMLTLLAYVRYVKRGRAAYPALLAFLALGLMAKPTLVTWPFVLLLLDWWPLDRLRDPAHPDRWDAPRWRRAVVEKLPLFAMVAAVSGVAVWSQSHWGTVQDLSRLPLALRLENAVDSVVRYGGAAFWPSGLAVFYPHPGATLSTTRVAAGAAALVVVSAAALLLRRRRPDFLVGWAWFLGMLVPVIGLVQVGQAARADRYTYLPLIGFSLPVVWSLAAAAERWRRARIPLVGVCLVALAALGTATWRQVERWHDSLSLFRHALAVTDNNHVAHINMGVALYNDEEYDRAARHLERALRIAPASATAAGVLADTRVATHRPEDALGLYRRALAREPDSVRWNEGLANALLDAGRADEAIAAYRKALERAPESARVHGNLGLALQRAGRTDEAIAVFEETVRLNPNLAEGHGNLAVALVEVGDLARAREHFERALELDPTLALTRAHYGRLLAATGATGPALEQLLAAVELDPGNGILHSAAARVLAQVGRRDEAIAHYRDAVALGEDGVPTLVGLAHVELAAGNVTAAVTAAQTAVDRSERGIPAVLGLLAEAQAAAGRFDVAARVAEEGAALAADRGSAAIAEDLRREAAGYRERAAEPPSTPPSS